MSFNTQSYSQLLAVAVPMVIKTKTEYQKMEAVFKDLLKTEDLSPEQDRLFDMLALLLEDYEKRTLPGLKKSSPLETLKFLMTENSLKQKDIADIFGSQGNASEVLNGRRSINLIQAKKLGEKFRLNPEAFI